MISRQEQHGSYTSVIITDTGISHRIRHIPNQDAVTFVAFEDDYVLAVSDGVGSCAKAEVGSNAAILAAQTVFTEVRQSAIETNKDFITNSIILEWKHHLHGNDPDDCCATLQLAMKIADKVLLLSIGDGLLVVTSQGDVCRAPAGDQLFINETGCLCKNITADDIWYTEYPLEGHRAYVVFACSDGVSNGLMEDRETDMVRAIESDTTQEEMRRELEDLIVEISKYSSDDRTLGVVKYEQRYEEPDWQHD